LTASAWSDDVRTAIIADIHGQHAALLAVFADIARARCDRVVCLGDVVDGGDADAACDRELMARGITTIRGNHDDLYAQRRTSPEAAWLRALPESITESGILFIHISPRRDDRSVSDRYIAWNVLDDTEPWIAFVGHVHAPARYGWKGATVGAARSHPIRYGTAVPLDASDRYIICPGAVGFPRDGDDAPRYAIHAADPGTIEFRRVT
jgi:predicted phosphodiesterase